MSLKHSFFHGGSSKMKGGFYNNCLCNIRRGGQGLDKGHRYSKGIYSCLCAKLSALKCFFWWAAYPLHLLRSASDLNPFLCARWDFPHPSHCRAQTHQPKRKPGVRKPVCCYICTLSCDPSLWSFPPGSLCAGSTSKH